MKNRWLTISGITAALALAAALVFVILPGYQNRAVDMEQVDTSVRIVIKFSHTASDSSPKGMAARRFADLVKERTDGRVEVQVYPNSQLYKEAEEVKALGEGAVQMIAPPTARMTDMFPSLMVLDLPYFLENYDEVHRALDGELGRLLFNRLKAQNMMALAIWDSGFKQMIASRPLRYLRDFEGLVFRTMPSRVLEAQFRQLGAGTLALPFNEVYSALEKGKVHGTEDTPSNIYNRKLYEVSQHITLSNHAYLGYAVMVNQGYWEALPEDVRAAMEEVLKEVTLWERHAAARENSRAREMLSSSGKATLHELTPELKIIWRWVLEPIHDGFAPVIGEDLMDAAYNAKKP